MCNYVFTGMQSSKWQTNGHFRLYTHECLFKKLLYRRVFTLNWISQEKSLLIKQSRFLSTPSHSLLFNFDSVLSPVSFVWFVLFFFSASVIQWSIFVRTWEYLCKSLQAPSFRTEQGYNNLNQWKYSKLGTGNKEQELGRGSGQTKFSRIDFPTFQHAQIRWLPRKNLTLSNLIIYEVKFDTLKLPVKGEVILTTDGALLHLGGATSNWAKWFYYQIGSRAFHNFSHRACHDKKFSNHETD